MAPAKHKTAFETEFVRVLGELLNDLSLTEIAYEQGDLRVRVTRQAVAVNSPPAAMAVEPVAQAAIPPPADDLAGHPGLLKAPMVGVVYTSPEPGQPTFVGPGDTVAVGDTVLLIEAMKVFNPIKAHRAGRINRIFISNGCPVEYGEPLLLIE